MKISYRILSVSGFLFPFSLTCMDAKDLYQRLQDGLTGKIGVFETLETVENADVRDLFRATQRGLDINVRLAKQGRTLLHIAALHKKEDCIEKLLALGADPHIRSDQGTTLFDDVKAYNDGLEARQRAHNANRDLWQKEHDEAKARIENIANGFKAQNREKNGSDRLTSKQKKMLNDITMKNKGDFVRRKKQLKKEEEGIGEVSTVSGLFTPDNLAKLGRHKLFCERLKLTLKSASGV